MIIAFLRSKKLSETEAQVVELYYQGLDEAQIAKRLNIPKVSIIAHLGKSRRKCGYDNNRMLCYKIREHLNGV